MPEVPAPSPWWALFAPLLVVALVWVVATPPSAGPDEPAHVLRAAAVAGGQVLGVPGPDPQDPAVVVEVPAGVAALPEPACFAGRPQQDASCSAPARAVGDPRAPVPAETIVGRHPPLYYALVGWAARALPGVGGLLLARAVSAAACAAFVATALHLARGSAWRVLGVLGATTPMAVSLFGVVNPNGLEAAAATALWAALVALVRSPAGAVPRAAVAAAGVSGIVTALLRPVSGLWVGLAVLAALAAARRGAVGEVLGDRAARAWAVAGAVVVAGALAWLAVVGNPLVDSTVRPPVPLSYGSAVVASVLRTPAYLEQLVGVLGWLDVRLPRALLAAWLGVAVALAVAGLRAGPPRAALALLAVGGAVVAVPALLEAGRVNDLGFIWQGRYTLPLAAGVPVLAAALVAGRGGGQAVAAAGAVLLAALQVVALVTALRRWTVGVDGPLALSGPGAWAPPVPPAVIVMAGVLAWAALLAVALGVRGGRRVHVLSVLSCSY